MTKAVQECIAALTETVDLLSGLSNVHLGPCPEPEEQEGEAQLTGSADEPDAKPAEQEEPQGAGSSPRNPQLG